VITHQTSGAPSGRAVLGFLLLWLGSYFAVRFYLEAHPGLESTIRLALSFIPTPMFGAFLWSFIRSLRRADELERRIQLEALAVAFPLGLLLLTTLGLVQRAVELDFQDWSYNHVWPMFVIFYLAGLAMARKRYR
jgi:hypothetical protein